MTRKTARKAITAWALAVLAGPVSLGLPHAASVAAETATAPAPGDKLMLILNKIKSRANLPGNLAVMDVTTDTVLRRIPVGNEPHEVAVSTDGKLAVVSNTGSYDAPGHTLSLIDVAAGKELQRVELGPLGIPHGLAYAGGKFYFTSETAKALGRFDPATGKVDWVMGLSGDGVHLLRFSPDGNTIYASERSSDRIAVVHYAPSSSAFTPEWEVKHWSVCKNPEGLDLSTDGRQLWVGCRGANRVAVIDTATGQIVRQLDTGTKALVRVKLTLDGRYALASDLGTGNVLVIDPKTMTILKTLSVGTGCEGILIAPDGRYAYVAATNDNHVAQIDLKTLTVSKHLHSGLGPDGMAWLAH